jgi:hypothetical protein
MADELSEDQSAYDDADMDLQSGGANTKGATSHGHTQDGNIRMANDGNSPADREELDDEYDEDAGQGFPARVSVNIERPGKGALAIEATAQDGDFVIEDLYYFPKADLADPKTAEKDWERRALYTGPPFSNLDEDLQILLEKYLEERGINTRLALFIPDYIDHKEQKEYVRWLDSKSRSLPLPPHTRLLTALQTSSSSLSKCRCISVYYLVMYFKALTKWSRKTAVYDRWRKSLPACATDTNQTKGRFERCSTLRHRHPRPSSGLISVEETVILCSTLLQTHQSQTFKPAVPALYRCEGVRLLARTPK